MNENITDKYRVHLMICAGTACVSNKSFKIKEVLEKEITKHGLNEEVLVVMTGCNGFCAVGPVMVVMPDGTHRRSTAQRLYRSLFGLGIPKDIVVVTESDVKNFGTNPSLVIAPALEEGRELYHV